MTNISETEKKTAIIGAGAWGTTRSWMLGHQGKPVVLWARDPGNPEKYQRLALRSLIAPLRDSIYVPQNTVWYKYREMAQWKYHDFFWLHLANKRFSKAALRETE